MLHLEFAPSVETYFPQPCTFKVAIGDDEYAYTPDFEVRYFSGTRKYVEVKPLKRSRSIHYQRQEA